MKEKVKAILLFQFIILFFVGAAYANSEKCYRDSVFVFPSTLEVVEEEAFTGTAVHTVIFPKGFLSIGDNAFESTKILSEVYIPYATNNISDTAFPQNSNLVIYGIEESYAQIWAEEHRIPFVVENIWYSITNDSRKISLLQIDVPLICQTLHLQKRMINSCGKTYQYQSKRPQDRSELNQIDYRFP